MWKHSIRFKITFLLAGMIACLIVLLLILNSTFSEKFYINGKKSSMLESYNKISEIMSKYSDSSDLETDAYNELEQLTSSMAITAIIVGSDWSTVYSSTVDDTELLTRLGESIFNGDIFKDTDSSSDNKESSDSENETSEQKNNKPDANATDKTSDSTVPEKPSNEGNGNMNAEDASGNTSGNANNPAASNASNADNGTSTGDNSTGINKIKKPDSNKEKYDMSDSGSNAERTILLSTDSYTLQKVYDSRLKDDYLELWGTTESGYTVLLRTPIQGIKDNVAISSQLITYVGLGILICGIILAYLMSGYITKPIKQLSHLSERMSEMDFEAKYEGNAKDELGILGNSMNELSDKLQENISQLKTANLELQRDIDKKEKIEEMRTDFLSNVSHELKTPIALIQGYAEGLKDGITEDPESMEFYCDVIIDEANKMNNMVKKLLTLNQIEFGDSDLTMERFNLGELINSVVNANELRANQKDTHIVFDASEEDKKHCYVWADEIKVEEVVTNYLSNAINHTDSKKNITVRMEKNDDDVKVIVYNSGNNIPEADLEHIWDKFYKVDKARTREYGGNGIGLSIVKAIMNSLGKKCGCENVSDGVEFWFTLDCKN